MCEQLAELPSLAAQQQRTRNARSSPSKMLKVPTKWIPRGVPQGYLLYPESLLALFAALASLSINADGCYLYLPYVNTEGKVVES